MIAATGLNKTYRDKDKVVNVFKQLDLHCQAGEYIALTGASGAGKTSLLQLLGCLDRPDAGEYWLDDEQVSTLDEESLARVRNQKIGFVFQTNHFVEYLNLIGNVSLPGIYQQQANRVSNMRPQAIELLNAVGLAHRINHLPQELSGGERQRAAIARALFNKPQLILADEPTGNLDEKSSERILTLLESLLTPTVTAIVVTHDERVAARASRRLTLRDGQLHELTPC